MSSDGPPPPVLDSSIVLAPAVAPTPSRPRSNESAAAALVTVVIPVMNGMPWLPEAVDSVLSQPGPVELIVCDGGSTDGSREWLLDHAARRGRLVFQPDSGQADALGRGFSDAHGEILGWLNADDRLNPEALGTVRGAFDRHPSAAIVSGGCSLIDASGEVIGDIPLPPDGSRDGLLTHPTNLPQPATFFRASAYRQAGGVDRHLEYAMDVDLWLRMTRFGGTVLLPAQILAQFRIHAGAKSSRAAVRMVREDLRVRLRHGLSPLSPTAMTLARRGYVPPLRRRWQEGLRRKPRP